MAYLSLSEIKKHLNIDADFHDDDLYLESLEEAAEEVISKMIDFPLVSLENEENDIPRSLKFAILLWIGSLYAVRESISSVSLTPVPHSLELLVDLYRDYKLKDEKF